MPREKKSEDHQDESRDVDLLKVQIYSDSCHTTLTTKLSFVFSLLIAVLIFFYTMFFQGQISGLIFGITFGAILVICFFYLTSTVRDYKSEMKEISNMLDLITQGKGLPSFEKLGEEEIQAKEVKDTSVNKSDSQKKLSLYEQGFLLFYATLFGLLAGVFGNLWATLFFEHIIRGDRSLSLQFLVSSLVLILIIATLVVGMLHFYKKSKSSDTRKS